jgi:ribosomal protein S11
MLKTKISCNISKILRNVKLKKQYIKKLKNKILALKNIKFKNYKNLNHILPFNTNILNKEDHLIMFVIDVTFSKTNTLLHVTDFSGKLKFFCSAGEVLYKGKTKKARFAVFRELYKVLMTKFKIMKSKPVALHLKNVGSNKFWLIKKLKKKFFIKIVRNFFVYPYNGCRKRKVRRKKFKKHRRNG